MFDAEADERPAGDTSERPGGSRRCLSSCCTAGCPALVRTSPSSFFVACSTRRFSARATAMRVPSGPRRSVKRRCRQRLRNRLRCLKTSAAAFWWRCGNRRHGGPRTADRRTRAPAPRARRSVGDAPNQTPAARDDSSSAPCSSPAVATCCRTAVTRLRCTGYHADHPHYVFTTPTRRP